MVKEIEQKAVISERFWREYKRINSNPAMRRIYSRRILEMEETIKNTVSYVPENTPEFKKNDKDFLYKNLERITLKKEYLEKQHEILLGSHFYPQNKLEKLYQELQMINEEQKQNEEQKNSIELDEIFDSDEFEYLVSEAYRIPVSSTDPKLAGWEWVFRHNESGYLESSDSHQFCFFYDQEAQEVFDPLTARYKTYHFDNFSQLQLELETTIAKQLNTPIHWDENTRQMVGPITEGDPLDISSFLNNRLRGTGINQLSTESAAAVTYNLLKSSKQTMGKIKNQLLHAPKNSIKNTAEKFIGEQRDEKGTYDILSSILNEQQLNFPNADETFASLDNLENVLQHLENHFRLGDSLQIGQVQTQRTVDNSGDQEEKGDEMEFLL